MIRSFLTITLRILWRNKVTSFVNIFSLSVGISSCIFIMLYVLHEASYDKFNINLDRIFRLEAEEYAKLPPLFGQHLKDNLPEVQNVAFLAMNYKNDLSWFPEDQPELIKHMEVNRMYADSTTFGVFSFSFLQGDPKTALAKPMSCVLTVSSASKLFGDKNPVGQMVEMEEAQYQVTGVIQDIKMSHIEIDMLISLSSFAKTNPEFDAHQTVHSWTWSATYLLATPGVSQSALEKKVNDLLSDINESKLIDTDFKSFQLRPLQELYFSNGTKKLSYGLHGNLKNTMILSFVGLFLLVLACVNYINLTTARSIIRAKEIAIKRLNGSSGLLVRLQLIGETVIITLISLLMAFTFVQLYMHKFTELVSINVQLSDWNKPSMWLALLSTGVLIGALAGIYPAIYLTAKQPVNLVKGGLSGDARGSTFRNSLMVFQFTLSLIMIVAVLVNLRQLKFLRSADLGFSKEQVIMMVTPDGSPDRYAMRNTFKKELLKQTGINQVSYCSAIPGINHFIELPPIEYNGIQNKMKAIIVDEDYLDVVGISLSEGRNFFQQEPIDQSGGTRRFKVILNETAVKTFGLNRPIDQVLHTADSSRIQLEIIGVVKDFNMASLHNKIEPLLILHSADPMVGVSIKMSSADIGSTLQSIEKTWKTVWTDAPFKYTFMDEILNMQYRRDEQLAKVIGYFTLLAVIIACLGLFALSSFMISRRTKEIGIRKTLGASVSKIYSELSWDFMKWVFVAIIIAMPIAWYLMKLWLQTFAYHITLGADIFIIAALLAISIALITVTGQSLKAANANPVKSLRYE